MKGSRFMCAAMAAAVSFAACQKSPVAAVSEPEDGFKRVVVKVGNSLSKSAATGAVSGMVTINDFQVFFADAEGNLHKGMNADGTAASHFLAAGDEAEFHYLSMSVEKVIVVANYFDAVNTTLSTTGDIMALPLDVDTQQNPSDLALFGQAELTNPTTDETTHPKTTAYTATVEVKPLVARMEVRTFGVQFGAHASGNTLFSSVKVNNVAFDNFYQTTDFKGALDGLKALNPGEPYVFGEGKWYLDKVVKTPGVGAEEVELTPANNVHELPQSYYAYHFFPNPEASVYSADGYPRIYLGVSTTNLVGDKADQQIMTKTFKEGGNAFAFEPGHIYQIDLTFPDTMLATEMACADVEITSTEWTVVTPQTGWDE